MEESWYLGLSHTLTLEREGTRRESQFLTQHLLILASPL